FMVGMEDGVFPHYRSMTDSAELEEERRLAYVGITRARKRLYLTHAWSRSLFGGSNFNPPSRFLSEIPTHMVRELEKEARNERAGAWSDHQPSGPAPRDPPGVTEDRATTPTPLDRRQRRERRRHSSRSRSPSGPRSKRRTPRAKARPGARFLILAGIGAALVIAAAVVADGYYQAYQAYKDAAG